MEAAATAEAQAGPWVRPETLVAEAVQTPRDAAVTAPVDAPAHPARAGRAGAAWRWALPGIALLLVLAGLGADYWHQQRINDQVESLRLEGERLALEGDYDGGMERIDRALGKRPQHATLQDDKALLTEAIKLKADIELAAGRAEKDAADYDGALKDIGAVQKTLKSRSGPLIDGLVKLAAQKEESVVVAQVSSQLPGQKKLEGLTPLLARLSPYDSPDAAKAAQLVKQKIADLSYVQASAKLKSKSFDAALQIVADALKYDEKNEKLLALQKTVKERKAAFEQAEADRIEKAIKAADAEDLYNRTDAVELVEAVKSYDEDGNFVVSGSIKNNATKPISAVTVYFDILDAQGTAIYADTLYVYPDYVGVGEVGTFYGSYYNEETMNDIQVTKIEWQIE